MTFYARLFSKRKTRQHEQARDEQRQNNAGGFAFVVDDWTRLERFLILGTEGGTYYASERRISLENARSVERCLAADGLRVVRRLVDLSDQGRAPKNSPAIFVLALAAANQEGAVRQAALQALTVVCRTGTHLFQFAESVQQFRGWGRGLRRAVAGWYNDKTEDALAYQVVKYQARNGWSHRDLMRLAHPDPKHDALYRWVVGGTGGPREVKRGNRVVTYDAPSAAPALISAYEELKRAHSAAEVTRQIHRHRFTHEMIPTEFKNSVEVWDAVLERMPMTALVRNLGKMTSIGLITQGSTASKDIVKRLTDRSALKRARVHPLALLLALGIYQSGHGFRGSLKWTPERGVVDALDQAFYLAFDGIEPTGKRILLALDVSGSMHGGVIGGAPGVTPMMGAAAMAMVTARTERDWHSVAFSSRARGEWTPKGQRRNRYGFGSAMVPLAISPRQRLDDVLDTMRRIPMGGTDCALPMLYATAQRLKVDAFCVFTDNETWAGDIHPYQALEQYRHELGIAAKLVVVGLTATEFSIANPDDAGMFDVVGFDTAAPAVMADFIRA
jgi:60 kDa SS-A/Ro ribonucleoprotein